MNLSETAVSAFTNQVLQIVVPLIAAFLAGLIGHLVRRAIAYIKANIDASVLQQMEWLANIVVGAAEQSGLAGEIQDNAKAKKAWALNELARLFKERGLPEVDFATLSTLIEKAVLDNFNRDVVEEKKAAKLRRVRAFAGGQATAVPVTSVRDLNL